MSALWNTGIKSAPHGRYVVKQRKEGVDQRIFVPDRVILSTKCGKVVLRWLMLGKGEQPLAWQAWLEPFLNSAQIAASNAGHAQTDDAVQSGDKSTATNPHLPSGAAACAADTPEAILLPASGEPINHESEGPKSRPGDAAASLTQQSSSPRQERPSAQERSSDRSGGQFGDAPKPAHIQRASVGVA